MNLICAHITGAEVWGRGTNRVIEMCEKHGARPPVFEERQGFLIATFTAEIAGTKSAPSRDQVGTKSGLSRDQVEILRLCREERSLVELMSATGRQNRTKFRDGLIRPLIDGGLLAYTIPDKPRSRMQWYRTTEGGLVALATAKASPPDSGSESDPPRKKKRR